MVVDDDEALRESVCEFLEDSGYHCLRAEHGQQALDVLRGAPTKPDLVLFDLMMPGMSGRKFREEQLRDRALSSIPAVLMTSSPSSADFAVDDTIAKPFRLD